MNSRSILAMTNDPDDFTTLTPEHFLIGTPLLTVPEKSVVNIAENRLSRYQCVRSMLEHFWNAWSRDYLHTLQQRSKWMHSLPDVKAGELVLLRNNLLPPFKWTLARVISMQPGDDGHVRIVTIKTKDSEFVRSISKICLLPID